MRSFLLSLLLLGLAGGAVASGADQRAVKLLPWCEFRWNGMHPANANAICAKILRVRAKFPRIGEALGLVGAEADGPGWPEDAIAAMWLLPGTREHPVAVTFRRPRWRDADAGVAGETMLHELGHVAAWIIDQDPEGRERRARWLERKSEEQWAESAKNVLETGRGNGAVARLVREYVQ